eukprot:5869535-Pleurochrysis_carterae.AAC.3
MVPAACAPALPFGWPIGWPLSWLLGRLIMLLPWYGCGRLCACAPCASTASFVGGRARCACVGESSGDVSAVACTIGEHWPDDPEAPRCGLRCGLRSFCENDDSDDPAMLLPKWS